MVSMIRSRAIRRAAALASVCVASCVTFAGSASARFAPGGQLLRPTHLGFNTNTSNNWFGYQQGALEQSGKLFTSITGNWTVPRATRHKSGQAEDSADWIGIGGGCVDTGCSVPDSTLIQTGTEQDVPASGPATYRAWYEVIPAPEIQISSMKVRPGNRMHASIAQTAPEVWKVTLTDVTRHESYTTTVPYPSTMDTAEWIEETPLQIGTNAGLAALPNLTNPKWRSLTVNGANPHLKSAEKIDLTNSSGKVIAAPSSPKAAHNGFNECTWKRTCR